MCFEHISSNGFYPQIDNTWLKLDRFTIIIENNITNNHGNRNKTVGWRTLEHNAFDRCVNKAITYLLTYLLTYKNYHLPVCCITHTHYVVHLTAYWNSGDWIKRSLFFWNSYWQIINTICATLMQDKSSPLATTTT